MPRRAMWIVLSLALAAGPVIPADAASTPRAIARISMTASSHEARGVLTIVNRSKPARRIAVERVRRSVEAWFRGRWRPLAAKVRMTPPLRAETVIPRASARRFRFDAHYDVPGGVTRVRVTVATKLVGRRAWIVARRIDRIGVVLAAGRGGVVTGEGGARLTVPDGAIPYPALVDVVPAARSDLVNPGPPFAVTRAYRVIIEPIQGHASVGPITKPLQLSVPSPAGLGTDRQVFLAGQAYGDVADDKHPEVRPHLFVASEVLRSPSGTRLTTVATNLSGIVEGGVYGVIHAMGQRDWGWVEGTVRWSGFPIPGATVSNSTNRFIARTGRDGSYALPVDALSFTVRAFEPLSALRGETTGAIPSRGDTVTADITVASSDVWAIARNGIRNGGFEQRMPDLAGWGRNGDVLLATNYVAPSGTTISNVEGDLGAFITTSDEAVGGTTTSLRQLFVIPAGVRELSFNYKVISEEYPELHHPDRFRVLLQTPEGTRVLEDFATNNSADNRHDDIGDCGFIGGDATCGGTFWRTVTTDVRSLAREDRPTQVTLSFVVEDGGDEATHDTWVFIDNIRFSTLWVDAKVLAGSGADEERVKAEIRQATTILSQAGVNVRLRAMRTIADPGPLVDLDARWVIGCALLRLRCAGIRQPEMDSLLARMRSPVRTDVNSYYIRSFQNLAACALAVSPDDYHHEESARDALLDTGGTFQVCNGGQVLAHELGHLLVSPQAADDGLEHGAAAGNFLNGGALAANGVLTRAQSMNVNRDGAPLLRP